MPPTHDNRHDFQRSLMLEPLPRFTYDVLPNRVLFGVDSIEQLQDEVERLGRKKALLLASNRQPALAKRLARLLGGAYAGTYDQAVQHVPLETIHDAVQVVDQRHIDVLVAAGGGSAIGLAKGIALQRGLPIIAIPTTYSGSEMTRIWGISRNGRKTTGRDPIVKPQTVIYDPQLLLTLPPQLSLISGINAMAHAVEALYAENANPVSAMLAEESIRYLARSLPEVAAHPEDINHRSSSLYGAFLAANVLDQVGMALHHKLCHTLGGAYNLPHAATHTVILPYAIAYNASHAPEAMAAIARALGCPVTDVAGAVQDISRQNGGPVALQELGFDAGKINEAAEMAMQAAYYNPRPLNEQDLAQLLHKAYHGIRP